MDPNATLREIRDLVKEFNFGAQNEDHSEWDVKFARLAVLSESLDNWITMGGFLPDSWEIAQIITRKNK